MSFHVYCVPASGMDVLQLTKQSLWLSDYKLRIYDQPGCLCDTPVFHARFAGKEGTAGKIIFSLTPGAESIYTVPVC